MQFVKVARVEDFDGRRFLKFKLLARNVAVFRDSDGSFFATEFSCKHQNWDLTSGRLEGDVITCARHHWAYNIRTGECLNHDSAPLRRYACKVEGDDVHVSLTPLTDEA
ncbi:MAG: Rieske (2Fe-2S) protein [bacterium]|nr:Rieske (2Fe-2S) protein [bacterium]